MKAAIFDMDGVLIDSEPLWRIAEKQVFETVGVELTDEMCMSTMGWQLSEVVDHWHDQFPWTGKSRRTVTEEIVQTMRNLIRQQGRPMPGVLELLVQLKDRKIALGLASSSPHLLIDTVVDKLDIRAMFDVLCSAADEPRGKPDPAVYLKAAQTLGIEPADCLAFEDSIAGIRAAQNAGMRVFAVPCAAQWEDPRFDSADLKLHSLEEFAMELLDPK